MGNELSVIKELNLAKRKNEKSMVFRGEEIDPVWIPDDCSGSLQLECLKLIEMNLVKVPNQLLDMPSLMQLNLSKNNLQSIRGIGRLCHIKDLDLSSNNIEFIPDEILSLPLEDLNLSNNLLTDRAIPKKLLESQYFTLDISCNELSEISPAMLNAFQKCDSLYIHSNPWKNPELAKLDENSTEEDQSIALKASVPAIPRKKSKNIQPKTQPHGTDSNPISENVSVTSRKDHSTDPSGITVSALTTNADHLKSNLLSPDPGSDSKQSPSKTESLGDVEPQSPSRSTGISSVLKNLTNRLRKSSISGSPTAKTVSPSGPTLPKTSEPDIVERTTAPLESISRNRASGPRRKPPSAVKNQGGLQHTNGVSANSLDGPPKIPPSSTKPKGRIESNADSRPEIHKTATRAKGSTFSIRSSNSDLHMTVTKPKSNSFSSSENLSTAPVLAQRLAKNHESVKCNEPSSMPTKVINSDKPKMFDISELKQRQSVEELNGTSSQPSEATRKATDESFLNRLGETLEHNLSPVGKKYLEEPSFADSNIGKPTSSVGSVSVATAISFAPLTPPSRPPKPPVMGERPSMLKSRSTREESALSSDPVASTLPRADKYIPAGAVKMFMPTEDNRFRLNNPSKPQSTTDLPERPPKPMTGPKRFETVQGAPSTKPIDNNPENLPPWKLELERRKAAQKAE